MRRAKLGLAPYINSENFRRNIPNKIVEYLSGGLPVLTSLIGATERLLGDAKCGYFYQHGSASNLLETINDAVENPDDVRRRSARARELFERSLSAKTVYRELMDLLEQLATHYHEEAPPRIRSHSRQ